MTSKEFIGLKILGTEAMIEYYQSCYTGTTSYIVDFEYINILIHYFQQEKRIYQQVLEDLND